LADQVDASIVPERLTAKLSGAFGVLGSLLAAIGMYGLLAYMAVRRVNEIGIRMALGATKNAIARMMFGEALKVTCIGLLIGVPTAYCATHFAAALIPDLQVKGLFPIVFAAAAMMLIALIAAYLPAYRAASTDPMQALRHE
jgi:ABC-type antimicrobial peptide transport system permease subunit